MALHVIRLHPAVPEYVVLDTTDADLVMVGVAAQVEAFLREVDMRGENPRRRVERAATTGTSAIEPMDAPAYGWHDDYVRTRVGVVDRWRLGQVCRRLIANPSDPCADLVEDVV